MTGIRAVIAAAVLSAGLLFVSPAQADCSNPAAVGGVMIYNADQTVMQYCNGTVWVSMDGSAGACIADPACPNVGDVCSGDGSGGGNPIFAGCMCYYDSNSPVDGSCKPVYATQSNQSTSSRWKNATGTDDIMPGSIEDGSLNHADRGGTLSDFPAFELCENLTDGGFTDWYLPARTELDLLFRNRAAIGGFTTGRYWSSLETSTNNAWGQTFGTSLQSGASKTDNDDVRCVRRD